MKQLLNRGFTLIELLVVIAIIGILAAVVLASLGDARDGASDTSAQQTLANAANQAEIYFNGNGFSYENLCSDPTVANLLESAQNAIAASTGQTDGSTGAQSHNTVYCHAAEDSFVFSAPLTGSATGADQRFWCVDSTGQRERLTGTGAERGSGILNCN